jgi:hypothetical protein
MKRDSRIYMKAGIFSFKPHHSAGIQNKPIKPARHTSRTCFKIKEDLIEL